MVADALQEALVQDYDGVIRVAPAIPPGWDFDGSVYVRGNTKVDVKTRNGAVTNLVIEAGTSGALMIRNPWPGKPVDVVSGKTGRKVVTGAVGRVIEFAGSTGSAYAVEQQGSAAAELSFPAVSPHASDCGQGVGPGSGLLANSH